MARFNSNSFEVKALSIKQIDFLQRQPQPLFDCLTIANFAIHRQEQRMGSY